MTLLDGRVRTPGRFLFHADGAQRRLGTPDLRRPPMKPGGANVTSPSVQGKRVCKRLAPV